MDVLVAVAVATMAGVGVWPPPQSMVLEGDPTPLAPDFHAKVNLGGAVPDSTGRLRLGRAVGRFNELLLAPARAAAARRHKARAGQAGTVRPLRRLELEVSDLSAGLSMRTDYSYSLSMSPGAGVATIRSSGIYGAMSGLETFAQLIDVAAVPASSIEVADAPDYAWRGLLVDVGRRFAPVPLLENVIDTMAAVKLNVLHLHASDFCRFAVESLRFPNLTAGLRTGPNAGFYSQEEVRALIAYGGDRGVRIMPEFEMPGHALGLLPLASAGGLEFCNTCAYGPTGTGTGLTCRPSQLWGTEGTASALRSVLGEMAALFTDEVFHIGADETFVKPQPGERCTENSTASLEKEVVAAVARDFGKIPAGWEQVLFETAAATEDTIVYAYMSNPAKVTAAGRRAVVANSSSLYFTLAAPPGAAGWHMLWYDIGSGIPADERSLLLGGEMSMWTDTYCSPRECGAMPAYRTEKGAPLYSRARDSEYGRSLGGMIWPRGYVGAAAFWNWNSSIDARSEEFADRIWALNDALAKRGALVCPSNCSCDQLTACGKPYVTTGDGATMQLR